MGIFSRKNKEGEQMRRLEIGAIVRDKITGFVGMATAKTSYITGCDRYYLTPTVDKDGKCPDGKYFDEGTLEVIENGLYPEDCQTKIEYESAALKRFCESAREDSDYEDYRLSLNIDPELYTERYRRKYGMTTGLYETAKAAEEKRICKHRKVATDCIRTGGPHDSDPTISNGGIK